MTSPAPLATLIEPAPSDLSSASPHNSFVLYGAVGLLLFGPLAFGATDPWSVFILESGSALLFTVWAIEQIRAGALYVHGNRLFLPMSAFALLIAIQLLGARTASKERTFSTAMLFVAYGVMSFLLVQSLRHTQQVRRLARVISFYGAAVAMFAMIQGLTSDGKVYWLLMPRFGGWIYGPYVNHNHYAGLMEMLTPVPLIISLSSHISLRNRWVAGFASALMGSSILLSGSRGGMIALASELLLLLAILAWQKAGGRAIGSIAAIASAILILFLWLGSSQLAERLSSIRVAADSEISNGTRLNIDRDGLRIFTQRPLLGWGLGAFPIIYPQFRSFYTDLYVDHAHNDYIQLLVEAGLAGLLLTVWFLAVVVTSATRKIRQYRFHTNGLIGMASLLGITGILVHSFVDFNLEIPANAAIFFRYAPSPQLNRGLAFITRVPRVHSPVDGPVSFSAHAGCTHGRV